MIKNTEISLNPNSQARIDAVNTIRYTLMLDYDLDYENIQEETSVNDILSRCKQCCSGLFNSSIKWEFNSFFGFNPEQDIEGYNKTSNHYISPYLDFDTLLLQQCIMEGYHAVISDLLSGDTVTSYELINSNNSYTSNTKKSSRSSDFNRRAASHFRVLNHIENLLSIKKGNSYAFKSQFDFICDTIFSIHASKWASLFKETRFKQVTSSELLRNIEDLSATMLPPILFPPKNQFRKIPERNFINDSNVVDGVYRYYIIERIFNFQLFFSLLENIYTVETKQSYRFNQKMIFDILKYCKQLPNSLSRQCFLKYAFEKINPKTDSYPDYWFNHDLSRTDNAATYIRGIPMGFQFPLWLSQYQKFFSYMAGFIIPVYEWCFISMIMEYIELKYPSMNHTEHLKEAKILLAQYITEEYQNLLQPVKLPFYEDGLSTVTKFRNTAKLEDLDDMTIKALAKSIFLPDELIELNLPLLNPNTFKNQSLDGDNTKAIRNFYIDLFMKKTITEQHKPLK